MRRMNRMVHVSVAVDEVMRTFEITRLRNVVSAIAQTKKIAIIHTETQTETKGKKQ